MLIGETKNINYLTLILVEMIYLKKSQLTYDEIIDSLDLKNIQSKN